ncbi:hypothetical protein DIPPA_02287 [Diplonema papillatum]|nr:hypothetical protein DIPPA_02287 [Diplonema papillatum]
MEVRTLRHLNHYRKPLSEQHSESTLAFQIDHSARRVEACVRRVRKLQHLLEATDVLQTRADDEVFFAEELLDVVENGEPKRAALMYGRSHTSTSLKPAGSSQHLHKSPLPPPLEGEGGGYYDDLLSPRLVHTSVSAPHATSRHSAKR